MTRCESCSKIRQGGLSLDVPRRRKGLVTVAALLASATVQAALLAILVASTPAGAEIVERFELPDGPFCASGTAEASQIGSDDCARMLNIQRVYRTVLDAPGLAQRLGGHSDQPGLFDPPLDKEVVQVRLNGVKLSGGGALQLPVLRARNRNTAPVPEEASYGDGCASLCLVRVAVGYRRGRI